MAVLYYRSSVLNRFYWSVDVTFARDILELPTYDLQATESLWMVPGTFDQLYGEDV